MRTKSTFLNVVRKHEPVKNTNIKKAMRFFSIFFYIGAFTIGGGYAMILPMKRIIVDRITVSIDAPDPAVYRDIRGTDFASVESNVLFLQEVKKKQKSSKPNVAIEVVAMKSNVLLLPNILPLASKLGINDILISNLMPFSEELSKEIIYDGSIDWKVLVEVMNSHVGKYRVNINFPKFELLTERMCKFIEKDSTVIRADGEVTPCYRLLHSYTEYVFGREKQVNAYSFGNAFEKPIYKI